MKGYLGQLYYEITRLTENNYKIYIDEEDFFISCDEEDLNRLIKNIEIIKQTIPIDVLRAKKDKICRICRKPISTPISLHFGKEYAHTECLEEDLIQKNS